MGTRDPRVDAYTAKSADFARPILRHLRAVVHAGCPDVTETIKWGHPHFEHGGMLCGMAAFKAHCAFGFWKHTLVVGGDGEKSREAMGSFGCLRRVADLPSRSTLIRYVKKAAKLNEAGVKVVRQKTGPKKPVRTPKELLAALSKNAAARAGFEAMSPSHKKEYAEWIAEAKGDDTRARRLATTLDWLAEGKSRNWKYVKK